MVSQDDEVRTGSYHLPDVTDDAQWPANRQYGRPSSLLFGRVDPRVPKGREHASTHDALRVYEDRLSYYRYCGSA